MSTLKLSGLSPALQALRLLSTDFGHLPAPCVSVSTVYPEQLHLALHDDLAGFESWREALGIAPESVEHRTQGKGRTRVLRMRTDYAGAALYLIAYAEVALPVTVGGAP